MEIWKNIRTWIVINTNNNYIILVYIIIYTNISENFTFIFDLFQIK